MNTQPINIRRALISVSDKTHLQLFAKGLHEMQIEIISTGGTANVLRNENLTVTDVSAITHFPEMMNGRVKTLHPMIHGGILGLREEHAEIAREHHIHWIDLIVVNLYPFAKTIQQTDVTLDDALENVDIGGPAMIRSAAKNMGWVCVIVDPNDYVDVLSELRNTKTISFETRQKLAAKAFRHTADYDAMIADWLKSSKETLSFNVYKKMDLRYGENPHQTASAWVFPSDTPSILKAEQMHGKPLSYNNIVDAEAAFQCVREYEIPACVIVKHATPCGIALGHDVLDAYQKALACDSVSAFGGIVALNRLCDVSVAEHLSKLFIEALIVPDMTPDAREILSKKPNLRILKMLFDAPRPTQEIKFIQGGLLIQSSDPVPFELNPLNCVTQTTLNDDWLVDCQFAWQAVKHIKSNAIVVVKNQATIGIGGGQVSRIDAVEMALKKSSENACGAILASDAFFPFRDSIDSLAAAGIRAVIQPGGSQRDAEVIAACDEHQIAMVFTGKRCFKH